MVMRISTLTVSDHVELRSTLQALSNRRFLCSDCLNQYNGRQDREKMTAANRRAKACEEMRDVPVHTVKQNQIVLRYNTCVGNFFSQSAFSLIESYEAFSNGVMPYRGGYFEQPNKYIEAMSLVKGFYAFEARRLQEEKRMRELSKGVRRGR